LLGNTQSFIDYECREDTAHKQFVAKQVREARVARMKASQLTRAGQLSILQQAIDECWFHDPALRMKFSSFADFLDFHEAEYGGESMEPWLARYYQWEQQEAETCQLLLLESQYVLSEGDSLSVIQREDDISDLVEPRE
jgi:hypothetical protein